VFENHEKFKLLIVLAIGSMAEGGVNPFAGEWIGNWITSSGQGGTVTLNITGAGVLRGNANLNRQ